jgi:hypothetical protein
MLNLIMKSLDSSRFVDDIIPSSDIGASSIDRLAHLKINAPGMQIEWIQG